MKCSRTGLLRIRLRAAIPRSGCTSTTAARNSVFIYLNSKSIYSYSKSKYVCIYIYIYTYIYIYILNSKCVYIYIYEYRSVFMYLNSKCVERSALPQPGRPKFHTQHMFGHYGQVVVV